MNKLIKSTNRLCDNIDRCVKNLIDSRLQHDTIQESGAMTDMESLLVASRQQLQCVSDFIGNHSVIEWQTGEPKEQGYYLVTDKFGKVRPDYWGIRFKDGGVKYDAWSFYAGEGAVVAWFPVSSIKPYKEETK